MMAGFGRSTAILVLLAASPAGADAPDSWGPVIVPITGSDAQALVDALPGTAMNPPAGQVFAPTEYSGPMTIRCSQKTTEPTPTCVLRIDGETY